MANKDNPHGFRALQTVSGTVPMVLKGLTTTGLTIAPGDAVIKDASTGFLTIATAASASIFGVCQSKVTGETGVSKEINYIPATEDVIWEGQCSGTLTQAMMGDTCDIEGTTGIMEVNENATSKNVVRLIELSDKPDNAMGANARVKFKFTLNQFA